MSEGLIFENSSVSVSSEPGQSAVAKLGFVSGPGPKLTIITNGDVQEIQGAESICLIVPAEYIAAFSTEMRRALERLDAQYAEMLASG